MLRRPWQDLELDGPARFLPKTILLARGVHELEALLELNAPDADAKSLAALDTAIDSFNAQAQNTSNPYLRKLGLIPHTTSFRENSVTEALVRAALLVVDARGETDFYPEAAALPRLPMDPLSSTGEPLHYERTNEGRGWKLWSVGSKEPILLEKKP
jgi:hypothetical protein